MTTKEYYSNSQGLALIARASDNLASTAASIAKATAFAVMHALEHGSVDLLNRTHDTMPKTYQPFIIEMVRLVNKVDCTSQDGANIGLANIFGRAEKAFFVKQARMPQRNFFMATITDDASADAALDYLVANFWTVKPKKETDKEYVPAFKFVGKRVETLRKALLADYAGDPMALETIKELEAILKRVGRSIPRAEGGVTFAPPAVERTGEPVSKAANKKAA